MKTLTIGAIVSIIFVISCLIYAKWERKKITTSLPKLQTAEQPIDTVSDQGKEVPKTPSGNYVVPSETIIKRKTDSGQMTSDADSPADAKSLPNAELQRGNDWQVDDTHAHEHAIHTENSFAKSGGQQPKLFNPSEMDPDELADHLHKDLINRFGDIPEVHTFIAVKRKILKKESLSLDEHIDYTAAQLHLFPHPETRKTLEFLVTQKETSVPKGTRLVR